MIVKYKRLHTYAELPKYATSGSACMDVTIPTTYEPLSPGEIRIVPLGFAVEIEAGYELQIRARSGLASRGIVVANGVGCVDSDYKSEVGVILMNMSGAIQPLNKGDRVCQIKIAKAEQINFEIVDELDMSNDRGGGFGHTGGHESLVEENVAI